MARTIVRVVNTEREGLQLRWFCQKRRRFRQRKAGTTDIREARNKARDLETLLAASVDAIPERMTWARFRELYRTKHLESLARKTKIASNTALNRFEQYYRPKWLTDANAEALSSFAEYCREEELSENAIAAYLRHLKAALGWAKEIGYIPNVPKIVMPTRTKCGTLMRSRPITRDEYEAILAAVDDVCETGRERWKRFLKGLWLSGLRLKEALALSWAPSSPVAVIRQGDVYLIRFWAEGQKSFKDEIMPVVPDWQQMLVEVPEEGKRGLVWPLTESSENTLTVQTVGRVIARIGQAAGVVVEPRSGKHATAHDFRRAFATRWVANGIEAPILRKLMRHASIQTTLAYYEGNTASEISRDLARKFGPRGTADSGNLGGDSNEKSPVAKIGLDATCLQT